MAQSSVILDWGRFGNVYLVPCPLFPLVQSGLPSHLICCRSLYTGSTSVQIHPRPQPEWWLKYKWNNASYLSQTLPWFSV